MIGPRAIKAGLLYCAVVFAAGFVFGTIRTMCVAPLAGQGVAMWLQAPVMLAVSWSACGWVAERLEVSESFVERLIMGAVALAVLIAVEAFIGIVGHQRTVANYFLNYGESGLLLGLLAQLGFAVFPVVRARRNRI